MILILGSTHDDILYFETQLKDKKTESIKDNVSLIFGTLFGQSVVLAYDVYSNYLSSAVTSYLIAKYDVLLVINVGIAQALENDFKKGDIVVAKCNYLGDVDLGVSTRANLGEIPNFSKVFHSNQDFLNMAIDFSNRYMITNFKEGVFVSLNKEFRFVGELKSISSGSLVLGSHDSIVFDTTSGGCATASTLLAVPFISFKVIYNNFSAKVTTQDKIKALKSFASLGKIVASIVIEVGRNDTISIDTH